MTKRNRARKRLVPCPKCKDNLIPGWIPNKMILKRCPMCRGAGKVEAG